MQKTLFFGLALVFGATVVAMGQEPAPSPWPLLGSQMHVQPQPQQVRWQQREFTAFVHFGLNTFANREWGEGTDAPASFNPTELDARQWVRTFKEAGMKLVIITAKHHDGFCLWPSHYTEYSVKNSPWKGGKGDVVGELAAACREYGLEFGVYLSPWDRHEPCYGDSDKYNTHYMNQLTELLTNYGPIAEVWFDGAPGEDSPLRKKQVYDFVAFRALVRQLQPNACMFADDGPDCRWVGNERGYAGETCWSMLDRTLFAPGKADTKLLNSGQLEGADWVPAECDVSIRPGWFYHSAEDGKVKTVDQLLDIYFASVGRNSLFLLNVPPDTRGLIHENDVKVLKAFRQRLDGLFATDLALSAKVNASNSRGNKPEFQPGHLIDGDPDTLWATDDGVNEATLELRWPAVQTFNVLRLEEDIRQGQRVKAFVVESWQEGGWRDIARGSTIGYRRLLRLPLTETGRLRIRILDATDCLVLKGVGLYLDSAAVKE